MPKNVELLDNANKDLDTKLNEIDAEFKNYLPLAVER